MNGIDLANFFSCIPGAKVIEPKRGILYFNNAFNDIQKCYQFPDNRRANIQEAAKIEKEGKVYTVSRFFAENSNRSWYLRRCKDNFGDKRIGGVKQWCFIFQREGDCSSFSLSFTWDYSYIRDRHLTTAGYQAFIEGVVIAVCDGKIWKKENFRLYVNNDYAADYGADLLNDVRSVLKDELLIQLYDRFMPRAEVKPRKEVDFTSSYRCFWWKNFFFRLAMCCGGWVVWLLSFMIEAIGAFLATMLSATEQAQKRQKKMKKSQNSWIK